MTSLKAYVLSVFLLPKAGPRAGKRRTPSSELLTSSPYKDLLRSKQIKLGEKSRADRMYVKKSDRRELHQGKRAPANGKAQQPLDDRLKRRPGSGRTESVYRCIYCNEVYEDAPTEDWLQCPECCQWHHEKCGNDKPVYETSNRVGDCTLF